MMTLIILCSAFVFFFALFMWFATLPSVRQEVRERRVIRRATSKLNFDKSSMLLSNVKISNIPVLDALLVRVPYVRNIAREIQTAGVEYSFTLLGLLSCVVFGLVLLILRQSGVSVLIACIIAGMFSLLPTVFVRTKIYIRRQQFEENFIRGLVIIKNALRSGQGLLSALKIVSEDAPWPLDIEFKRVLSQVEYGVSLDAALRKLDVRINLEEVSFFISAVIIQRESGGNLADIMQDIEDTIRIRFELKREMRTLSAQGKLSGVILCIIPVALFVLINTLNPGYLQPLIDTPHGIKMLVGAIILGVAGVFWIFSIVRIRL